ncbi:hypothetical protein GGI25_003615 [Coemansia spiralis]|uniref:Small ribosomal subunit protein mS41 n=2 Tax=Coemansia TaxID=4863 RepID=A0A9W8KY52_9FUNG|nr:IGR protein motif-domain-containing protein [Coemansia spiralis]KAJ1996158.1 hypothetical protein EDC05_000048 [Coemansia umbellata]KAJ2626085.1 hypothetical protein GGI26_000169 [Coemansia sp. RSA 1358]KAJ2676228.1 hypothetical protein GGI25_003615 [Coemansia spiralis]
MSLLTRLATGALAFRSVLSRSLSTETAAPLRTVVVPSPRGQFNNPEVFLKTIGRGCDKFTDKFADWDQLFRTNSLAMKTAGIGAKQRKWILMWTNKFRLGIDPYFIPTSKKHTMKRTERLARSKRRRLNKMNKRK